jgi:phosphomannomutase
MLQLLQQLRNKVAVGFVGGSDLAKQQEQLGSTATNGTLTLDAILIQSLTCSITVSRKMDLQPINKAKSSQQKYPLLASRSLTTKTDLHPPSRRRKVPRTRQFLSPLHRRSENSHQAVPHLLRKSLL